jgi:hypothetical protein
VPRHDWRPPLVELVFAALPQRDRERIPEGHRLTEAEVHSLPTCRAVGMCRVACEHDASRPVALSYSLVDAKPGSPDHVGHPHVVTRPARVQELLRERNVRLFRRVVDVGHQAERPVGKRSHDQDAVCREEQHNLIRRQTAFHPDVSEREGER